MVQRTAGLQRLGVALLVVCCLAAYVRSTVADEFHGPHVVELTSKTYDDTTSDGKVYFVKYYAPWCGHCKRLADTWKKLGEALKGNKQVAVAHVDCTIEKDICNAAEIKGYPTLKIVYKGEGVKAYRGPRELSALKTFLLDSLKELTSEL